MILNERLDPEGKGKNVHVCIAYTYDEQPALELKKELEAIYPDSTIICDPLSLGCFMSYWTACSSHCCMQKDYLGKKLRFLSFNMCYNT